ncbi:alpha/beta hydrolase [Mesobaculum littorinae]|uniref:Alpha/beta hydrolase n=1 Tax=Mesobaculum littorinae TaxID=2486419 RepID=A0A438AN45_9RHOB|nr:alpha/beta hydrolase [Mesobaculum littorinae]RVV99956.1 alpha/beta hydrolase [Mesobaculum littorinae]
MTARVAPGIDWNDAFDNSGHVPGAEALLAAMSDAAAAFRAAHPPQVLAYGPGPRQKLDLFHPDGPAHGLVTFIHGGYWRSCDRADFSHLAQGALARGWMVALPSYTLAPEAGIGRIGQEIAAAIACAAERTGGPIRIAGHSAGGHLALRMACAEGPLARALRPRVARILGISGIYDLRPLLLTEMNDTLQLTPDGAVAESPALTHGLPVPVTLWTGAAERPEFLRQARLMAEAWPDCTDHYAPGQHHFSVIDGLADPDHPLTEALLT